MTRKRFVKLGMSLGLSRNEANYIADIVRIINRRKS
jgi:hypothetical protein